MATADDAQPLETDLVHVPEEWLQHVRVTMTSRGFMTQQALAEAAGVSRASITRLFRNLVGSETVLAVAQALGLQAPSGMSSHELDQRWAAVGPELRKEYPDLFFVMLMALETRLKARAVWDRMMVELAALRP